jgi:hypothetical protein
LQERGATSAQVHAKTASEENIIANSARISGRIDASVVLDTDAACDVTRVAATGDYANCP